MIKKHKVLITILLTLTLVGCGSKNSKQKEDQYYENYPDILDFGHMSGVEPEIDYEESDQSIFYLYHIEEKVDQEIFKKFVDNLTSNNYKHISKSKISDDGGVYDVLENDRNQIMIGEYYDNEKEFTYKLLISIRPKYITYDKYDIVPDYGKLSNQVPSESLQQGNMEILIYEDKKFSKEYLSSLSAFDYIFVNTSLVEGNGELFLYTNEIYNVTTIVYPDYIAIGIETIGEQ